MDKYQLVALVGSLRRDSYNRQLLEAIRQLAERCDIEVASIELPLYNDDLNVPEEPEQVQMLKQKIREADGLLIVTPEYNHSVPGVLKNAIDWLSREPGTPLRGKPTMIAGASPGVLGTVRAQSHLRQIFAANQVNVLPGNEIFVGQCHQKFENGQLVDESTRNFISKVLLDYYEWIDFWKRNAKN